MVQALAVVDCTAGEYGLEPQCLVVLHACRIGLLAIKQATALRHYVFLGFAMQIANDVGFLKRHESAAIRLLQ